MFVRFWGTRGSIPAPGPQTAVYGGNTSCVEVRLDDGTVIILDAGTGIRELGLQLLQSGTPIKRLYLLIGHMHWDHIQGFPFFPPAFLPTTELNIFAPTGFQRSLEDSLSGQMQYSYFPIKLQDLSSRIHYTELEEGFFRLGEVLVETQYLNHTAPTLAYRITANGATVAYVTDHEPYWNAPGPVFRHPGDQRHVEFLRGADLVIHDAQYSEAEYRNKRGWGHSSVDYATDVGVASKVERLALFHHDPGHTDDIIRSFEQYARARAAANGSSLNVFAAAEGMELELIGKGSADAPYTESALARRPTNGGRILVVTDRPGDIAAIEQALGEDGLVVTPAPTESAAVEQTAHFSPDLVIMSSRLTEGDGAGFFHRLRSSLGKPELPILILTEDENPDDAPYSAESIATDYLSNPFSPPMLRSRVRVWLARTMPSLLKSASVARPPAAGSATALQPVNHTGSVHTEIAASVSLFQALESPQLEKMLARSSQATYPPGHAVIHQGEPGPSVYVILSGRVRIVETLPENPIELFLGELGAGEVFGELGIMRERLRSATVIPLEQTTCLIIPEADFLAALQSSSALAIALARVLAGRLYKADRLLARYGPDPLTGLPGRRALNDLYTRIAAGARRRGSSLLLLAIDVVHLKAINDRYGYITGDDLLRAVADVLLECSRGTDLVARYGTDEFAALLVEAGASDADIVVERIQQKFRQTISERNLPATSEIRIGYAVSQAPAETLEELLRQADLSIQSRRPSETSTL